MTKTFRASRLPTSTLCFSYSFLWIYLRFNKRVFREFSIIFFIFSCRLNGFNGEKYKFFSWSIAQKFEEYKLLSQIY